MADQQPFKLCVERSTRSGLTWPHRLARSRTTGFHPVNSGSNPDGVTILEMARELGAALAAPPSADSAAKGYFKSGRSCRLNKE